MGAGVVVDRPDDPGELAALRRRVAELEARAFADAERLGEMEREIRGAREFVHTILDTIPDPIFVKDEQHRWILLNQAFCAFMGHPRESLLGKSDYDFFPKEEADVFWRLDDLVFATGAANENEETFTDRSGEVHVISTKKALCRDAAGRKILAGVIRDISLRVRAEEALRRAHEELELRVRERTAELEHAITELRESEERFRATFEQAAVGIAHLTTDGRFLRVNGRLCEILGYAPNELLGRDFDEITFPDDLVASERARVTAESGGPASLDKRYVRKDGAVIWAHLTTKLARDAAGQPTYLISVIEDIAARKGAEEALRQSEAQLRQAQKMEAIGRLAGGVAHDFNNLLLVISGCTEVARKRLAGESEQRALLDEVIAAANRAAGLTRQLLAFSRQQVLQPKVLDLSDLLSEAVAMLRRLIGEDIDLRTRLAFGSGRVRVDPGQMTQVLMNLAVNARDAMPDGGTLDIETADVDLTDPSAAARMGVTPGRYIACAVKDSGCGMDPGTQARIFDPFFTTKPPGKGTGLGLSTVYGIVKQSGGAVAVESEIGRGTTFTICLPHAPTTESPGPLMHRAPRSAAALETILLVDDDPAVRRVVRRLLESNGYSVIVAASPEQAIEAAASTRTPIRLLLTDVIMPRMNGRQLAERISALHPEVNAVYMSGYAPDAVIHHDVLEANIAFLHKPFGEEALFQALDSALR